MNLRSRNKVDATFNMSSMTDIVFLLLIFFIVLSTFVTVHGLDIDLPKVASNKKVIHTEIVVEVTKDYTYMVNGKETNFEGVKQILQSKLGEEEFPSMVLRADAEVSWEKGMEVIAEAKKIGYEKIVVRTQAK
ncbi:MAG: biopolymer transport protein ExbD [Saprospiraceae bacterium]|jgi:biopolymer transport protein ExbD